MASLNERETANVIETVVQQASMIFDHADIYGGGESGMRVLLREQNWQDEM